MAKARALPRSHGARSETGHVRTANEDRMAWSRAPYGDIYVVSDGMGGYRGGGLAAEITVHALQEHLAAIAPNDGDFSQHVHAAFAAANAAVYQRRRPDDPDTRDMGATGVVLIVAGARAMVGHVGDSRAYLWRRGQLTRLTRDHTRVQKMLDAGMVTPEQAESHPDASVLDRAIGHQPSIAADVSQWIPLKSKDMVLLCSDGLCGYVSDAEISQVLASGGEPQALVEKLVERALDKGGEDNVTVQLVRLGGRSPSLSVWLGKPFVVLPVCVVASAVVAHFVVQVQLEEQMAALRSQSSSQPSAAAIPPDAKTALKPESEAPTATPAVAAAVASAAEKKSPPAGSNKPPVAKPRAQAPAASARQPASAPRAPASARRPAASAPAANALPASAAASAQPSANPAPIDRDPTARQPASATPRTDPVPQSNGTTND